MVDYRLGCWGGDGFGGKFQDIMWGIVVNDWCLYYIGFKIFLIFVELYWFFIFIIICLIQWKI